MIKSSISDQDHPPAHPPLTYSIEIKADLESRRLLIHCPELGIDQDCLLQKTTAVQVLNAAVRQIGEQIKSLL